MHRRIAAALALAALCSAGEEQSAPREATYNPLCGEDQGGRWAGVDLDTASYYTELKLGGLSCFFDDASLAEVRESGGALTAVGQRLSELLDETKSRFDAASEASYELVIQHVPIYFEYDYCNYPADKSAHEREQHAYGSSDCQDQQFSYSGWSSGANMNKRGAVEAWQW